MGSLSSRTRFTHPTTGVTRAVLLIEPLERNGEVALRETVMRAAQAHPLTKTLRDVRVYPQSFPVDKRHNAKIEREKLAQWATVSTVGLGAK